MRISTCLLGLTAALFPGTLALAGDCATATPIAGEGLFFFDGTVGPATPSGIICALTGEANMDEDVWYEWTATVAGDYRFDTCAPLFESNTVLAIYSDCVGTCIASGDDECGVGGLLSQITLTGVNANDTVWIQVADWALGSDPDALDAGILEITLLSTGDECASAVQISGEGAFAFDGAGVATASGTTCPLTGESDQDEDMWFAWTALAPGDYVFDTCDGGIEDNTVLAAFADCAGTCLASGDDGCGTSGQRSSMILTGVMTNDTYLIQVADWTNPAGPDLDELDDGLLTILNLGVAGNDCATAVPIVGEGSFPYDGNIGPAAPSGITCSAFGEFDQDEDIWFSWTALSAGDYLFDTCIEAGEDDTVLAIYADCVGTCLAAGEDECGNQGFLSEATLAGVNSGDTFLVQVADWANNGDPDPLSDGILSVTNLTAAPPQNDTCATPVPIALSGSATWFFDSTFASNSGVGSTCASPDLGLADVWFSFTAPKTGDYLFSTCGSSYDTLIAAYPTCGVPTCLGFDDDSCSTQAALTLPLLAGETIMLQVSAKMGLAGPGQLQLSGPNPANDECTNAEIIEGTGVFPFDNNCATDSGTVATCTDSFGPLTDRIPDDVWFLWVAPCDGDFRFATCGFSPEVDTKIAVYDGNDCATSLIYDCNDDAPGCDNFSSRVTLLGAQAMQTYLIQVGVWAGETGAPPYTQGSGELLVTVIGSGAENYCETGVSGAVMSFSGSLSVSTNDFTLIAGPLPDSFGVFYFGPEQFDFPFGGGFRCVGGGIFRIQPAFLPSNPPMQEFQLDFTTPPGNEITAGSCWNFQYWFRIPVPLIFDLSDGLAVRFGP